MDIAEIAKARRRIKRFLGTGCEQARVYLNQGTGGTYKQRHYVAEVRFRLDRLGRVYLDLESIRKAGL